MARGHTPHWNHPGVHSPIHTVFLTLCPVRRKELSSILPLLNFLWTWTPTTSRRQYKHGGHEPHGQGVSVSRDGHQGPCDLLAARNRPEGPAAASRVPQRTTRLRFIHPLASFFRSLFAVFCGSPQERVRPSARGVWTRLCFLCYVGVGCAITSP